MIPEIPVISRRHGEGDITLNDQTKKRHRLAHEILVLVAVCLAVTLALYFFLTFLSIALVEEYCLNHGIDLDEEALYHLDTTVFGTGLAIAAVFFTVMFLSLFSDRISYVTAITKGVDTVRAGDYGYRIPIEGNNELTTLAEAVNYLAETERAVKEKEKMLSEEKAALIRALSHDIRTPLTSIISYTELLAAKENGTQEEYREHMALVLKKAEQIKSLTEILLDGGKREIEYFEDARLLMEQLVCDFEQALEDDFILETDLSECPSFCAHFDVRALQRIFDNLISNIRKYADPTQKTELSVSFSEGTLTVVQRNAVKKQTERTDSYRMGLYSIRSIAQNYGGNTEIRSQDGIFEIRITLSDL